MAVACGRLVNRILELEFLDNARRPEVEDFRDLLRDGRIVKPLPGRSVGVDENADRTSHADGVGKLDQAFVRDSGCDKVLRYVAGGVGGASVHFGRVLPGETAATMRTLPAVGVHDYLAPCEPGVPGRAADDELPRRVDMKDELPVEKGAELLGKLSHDLRNEDAAHVFLDFVVHGLVRPGLAELPAGLLVAHPAERRCREFIMLGGDHDGVDSDRLVVGVIFYGVLGLGVRAEIRHEIALMLANIRESTHRQV